MTRTFFHLPLLQRLGLPSGGYYIFSRRSVPLLIFPHDRQTALETLTLYSAQTFLARAAYMFLSVAIRTGLYRFLLRKIYLSTVDVPGLMFFAPPTSVGLLLCNPEHGHARCVCVLRNGDSFFLAKVCDEGGKAILQSEWENLRHFSVPGIPIIGTFEVSSTNPPVAGFLMEKLQGRSMRQVDTPETIALLRSWLRPDTISPLSNSFLKALPLTMLSEEDRRRLDILRVRRSFYHGDFHPWNLIATPSGVAAVDFEWALDDGIAGLDLAEGLSPLTQVNLSPEAKQYLEDSGWSNDIALLERLTTLIRFYRFSQQKGRMSR